MKLLLRGTSVNFFSWWRVPGSNRWPPACKAGALPAELTPHIVEIKSTTYAFNTSVKCSTVSLFLLSKSNPLRWALIWFLGFIRSGGPRTRFPAGKPRRLQQSTGLLPRAAFRVHFGILAFWTQSSRSWLLFRILLEVVGQNGLEPSTSRLSVVCSSQLSYWPIFSFHIFIRYIFCVPSKLNNAVSIRTLCTDLRTLLESISSF